MILPAKLSVLYSQIAAALLFFTIGLRSDSVQAGFAYSALRQEKWRVYVQDTPASVPKAVGSNDHRDQSAPALSPDGSLVAFEVQGSGIHICFLQATTPCHVIRTSGGVPVRPVWHPVTGELVFVKYTAEAGHEDSEILTADPNSGKTVPFLMQSGIQDYPDFSTDGRTLVYSVGYTVSLHRSGVQVIRQLWLMDLERGSARPLTSASSQDIQADWSPSGKEIAFASNRSGQFEIWVTRPDGSGLRQITSGSGAKTWPAWSPDGKSIMFTRAHQGRQGLWIIDIDGSKLRVFEPFGANEAVEIRDADWR